MKYILFIVALIGGFCNAQTLAERNCTTLRTKLAEAGLPLNRMDVPLDYSKPNGEKLSMAYWVRPGFSVSIEYPPLLLIHGGPGGGSARLASWTAVHNNYPGDIIGIDVRGDGCSSPLINNLMPEDYANLRARNIVRDLEVLRVALYGEGTKWRVFGQSRGSVTGHYYLDMFPDAIESLHLHGFSMAKRETMEAYSRTRAFFSARAAYKFVERYPGAGYAINKLKQWLSTENICFDYIIQEDTNLKGTACGVAVIDTLSFDLVNQANWSAFNTKLQSLLTGSETNYGLNLSEALKYLKQKLESNTYTIAFNYIAGTNAQDMGHPNPEVLSQIILDPYIKDAPVCEGRYIVNVMMPWFQSQYGYMYKSGADPINHERILGFMKDYERRNQSKFIYNLYASENDTVAGPEAYVDEQELFGSYVNYQLLLNSGHDGWITDAKVVENLLKRPSVTTKLK